MNTRHQYQPNLNTKEFNWSKWICIRDAAKRLECSEGHLRRKCKATLEQSHDAMLVTPPDGGKPSWFIRRLIDKRLLDLNPNNTFEDAQQSLLQFTDKQRKNALLRAACVKRFRSKRKNDVRPVKSWIDHFVCKLAEEFKIKVSRGTLYRWDSLYKEDYDITPLIDTRGGDYSSKGAADAWAYFEAQFLDDRRPSIRLTWQRTKDEADLKNWTWCSLSSCRYQLNDRIPPIRQIEYREPAKFRQQYAPYIEQDPERHEAGRCWVSDHCQLDVMCYYRDKLIRPWITTWQDWRTRRITGWVLSPSPNSHTILAAFYRGMKDQVNLGGPSEVWMDNGRDYDSFTFTGTTKKQRLALTSGYIQESQFLGLFELFAIKTHFSIAYNPNGKARMERWFRTLHENFDVTFPTYTGPSISKKPESLKRVLNKKHLIPRFEDIKDRLDKYIKGFNASTDHQIEDLTESQQKLSPDQAMNRWCDTKIVHNPQDLEMFMLNWCQPQKVTRNGVSIRVRDMKLSYGMLDASIRRLMATKKKVLVGFNPFDLGSVFVFNNKLQLITIAESNPKTGNTHGATHQEVGDAMKDIRAFRKAEKVIRQRPELAYLSDNEVLAANITALSIPGKANSQPTGKDGQSSSESGARNIKFIKPQIKNTNEETNHAEAIPMAAGAESFEFDDEIITISDLHESFQSDEDEYCFDDVEDTYFELEDRASNKSGVDDSINENHAETGDNDVVSTMTDIADLTNNSDTDILGELTDLDDLAMDADFRDGDQDDVWKIE